MRMVNSNLGVRSQGNKMAAHIRVQRRRRREMIIRRPRVFRDRSNPLEEYNEEEIFMRYRFRPPTIMFIMNAMGNGLETATHRNSPLPPLLQLLTTLRFLATGAIHMLIADTLLISRATANRTITKVTRLLSNLAPTFVKFPSPPRSNVVKSGFAKVAGFPNVVGCIDGTQIRLQRPVHNELDFVNRKGYHSLNVQMCCDHQFNITSCTATWPGSVHDSRIFRSSRLCAQFENGEHDGFLLGDSGYACRNFLLTPYLNPVTPEQLAYNEALCRTRVLIEQTFGILKRRFQVLHVEQRTAPGQVIVTILSCVVLHNIGIQCGDIIEMDDVIPDEEPVPVPEREDLHHQMREHIVRAFFT